MCLQITVRVNQPADSHAIESLVDENAVPVRRRKRWWRATNEFDVSDDGCACSLLTDDADWNAATWDMLEDARLRLGRTIEALGKSLPNGFTLEALWIGETPDETRTVTADELARIACASELGTKTRYEVMPTKEILPTAR
jgi:hypothetical protein